MAKNSELKRVLIMAGGTGGHVFPGIAVANYLRAQGIDVQWMGTKQGIESRLVPAAGIPLHLITVSGLRGKGIKPLITAPFTISSALMQARRVIKQVNPDIVIGMGGFASGPGGVATWLMRRPLVIHEQNAKAGYTNKMLGQFAARILEGFPAAFKPAAKVISVGNPVRTEIESLPTPEQRMQSGRSPFRLLVVGGSLGAQALNEVVPAALALLPESERPDVWHQAGDKHREVAEKNYKNMGIQAKVVPFIEEMADAYSWADMVLCRAGALTVSELCAAGLGAVLVPYPHAVDDHQTANASFMVQAGAAICVQQRELTAEKLADIVRQFSSDPKRCMAMAQAARGLRHVNVQKTIATILAEVVRGESH